MTELKNINNSIQVCVEESPILKMCFSADNLSIWVSTSNSSIRCWKLPTEKHIREKLPMPTNPVTLLPGGTAIQQAIVLNDKRHIITKDSESNVAVYDVLKVSKNKLFKRLILRIKVVFLYIFYIIFAYVDGNTICVLFRPKKSRIWVW